MRSHRTALARLALIAAVPASAVAASAVPTARLSAGFYLAIVAGLAAIAAALGPIALAGTSRIVSALIALGAGTVLWLGGLAWLLVAFVSLCSDSTSVSLLTLGTAAAVYVPASIVALRSPRRAMWGWPLAVAVALAVSLGVLALATGGPHACEL